MNEETAETQNILHVLYRSLDTLQNLKTEGNLQVQINWQFITVKTDDRDLSQ